jgi:hypothetical protein
VLIASLPVLPPLSHPQRVNQPCRPYGAVDGRPHLASLQHGRHFSVGEQIVNAFPVRLIPDFQLNLDLRNRKGLDRRFQCAGHHEVFAGIGVKGQSHAWKQELTKERDRLLPA